MRSIGLVIVFLVVTWIGLGFLLSDNLNTHQALAQVQQQVDQAIKDKKAAQDRLNVANAALNRIQRQNGELIQQNVALQEQIKQSQGTIQGLKNQNTDLQGQLEEMKKMNALVSDLIGISSQSLMLAIFVPILPVSLCVTFIGFQYNRRRSSGQKPGQGNKSNRNMSINVTEEEMQQIVRMRRDKL